MKQFYDFIQILYDKRMIKKKYPNRLDRMERADWNFPFSATINEQAKIKPETQSLHSLYQYFPHLLGPWTRLRKICMIPQNVCIRRDDFRGFLGFLILFKIKLCTKLYRGYYGLIGPDFGVGLMRENQNYHLPYLICAYLQFQIICTTF